MVAGTTTMKQTDGGKKTTAAAAAAEESSGSRRNSVTGQLQCRFYERQFPQPDELVMVKVQSIEELGVYVSLLEYGNLEGLILTSELSKRRFRSITKLVRVGRQEVAMVVRVDAEKGYVDLSKRRVAPEDIAVCESRFSKSKKVHLMVRQVASKLKMPVQEVLENSIWPLYRRPLHPYDALKDHADDLATVFEGTGCDPILIAAIAEDLKSRLTPHVLKMRARLHVSCAGMSGILAVKEALAIAEAIERGPGVTEVKMLVIASPIYSLIVTCDEKDSGMDTLNRALAAVKAKVESYEGGDAHLQGEIAVIGGADKPDDEEGDGESESSGSSESSLDSEEEDEGMGRADDDEEEPQRD